MANRMIAGAAHTDITPADSQFLYGYPHVRRYSTGVHDPLLSSALYLDDGQTKVIFIANEIVFVTKALVQRARQRIADTTGVPAENVTISATHTHSGPITVRYLSNEADPVVPEPDPTYLQRLEDGMVEAAQKACQSAKPAELGLAIADGACVGTNRRDPTGPSDPQVPVLVARELSGGPFIGVMLVCSMHPTVLHEDSTLVSGDFPAMCRQYLQTNVVGTPCPVIHHTGASGNQSPRHVTQSNTFEEAERLGYLLGRSVEKAIRDIQYLTHASIASKRSLIIELPIRQFLSSQEAATRLTQAKQKLDQLRASQASPTDVRTAECDWFGAEETLTLARAAESGALEATAATCLPVEIQLIRVGPWSFVSWPGEVFVEFALAVKDQCANTFVITLANGELQGYQVTAEAVTEGGYEASNALFQSPDTGQRLVETTIKLCRA